MPDIKTFLTQKVGPLPMGVWIGTVGAGLYVLHKRKTATAPAPDTYAPTDTADQTFPSSSPPGYSSPYGGGGYTYGDAGGISGYGAPQIIVQTPNATETYHSTVQQRILALEQTIAGIKAQIQANSSKYRALKKQKQTASVVKEERALVAANAKLRLQLTSLQAQLAFLKTQLTVTPG